MTTPHEKTFRSEVAERGIADSRPAGRLRGRPESAGKQRARAPAETPRGGPGIWGKTHRDNVGKDPFTSRGWEQPAKTWRKSRQGRADRRKGVWHMSPYERRRGGNALRGDEGRPPTWGNASGRQRGSGHWAVPGWPPCNDTGQADSRSRNEPEGKPGRAGVHVDQHLSLALIGKALGGKAQVRTGIGKTDLPGSQGGPGKRGPRWNWEPIPQPKGREW
jgi:hypothetical protein